MLLFAYRCVTGAIEFFNIENGSVTITDDSSFSGNNAAFGGGIFLVGVLNGDISISDSSFTSNTVNSQGVERDAPVVPGNGGMSHHQHQHQHQHAY